MSPQSDHPSLLFAVWSGVRPSIPREVAREALAQRKGLALDLDAWTDLLDELTPADLRRVDHRSLALSAIASWALAAPRLEEVVRTVNAWNPKLAVWCACDFADAVASVRERWPPRISLSISLTTQPMRQWVRSHPDSAYSTVQCDAIEEAANRAMDEDRVVLMSSQDDRWRRRAAYAAIRAAAQTMIDHTARTGVHVLDALEAARDALGPTSNERVLREVVARSITSFPRPSPERPGIRANAER